MSVPSFSVSPSASLFQGSAGRPANSNPSKKRDRDCIVQPSSKKRAIVDSSAEQDSISTAQLASSKQAMIDSSAERPAHRRVNPRIPYIYCPRWCLHREPELLIQTLERAMTVASTIINVVFDNENDAKHLKLKDIWNEQFATLSVQAFVSLYLKDSWQLLSCKDIDPINKSACVMLTFSSSDFTCYRIDCCRRGICSIAHLFLSFSTASITMPMLECPCGRQFDIRLDATLKKKLIEQPKLTPLQPSRGLIDLPMANQRRSVRLAAHHLIEQRPINSPHGSLRRSAGSLHRSQ